MTASKPLKGRPAWPKAFVLEYSDYDGGGVRRIYDANSLDKAVKYTKRCAAADALDLIHDVTDKNGIRDPYRKKDKSLLMFFAYGPNGLTLSLRSYEIRS